MKMVWCLILATAGLLAQTQTPAVPANAAGLATRMGQLMESTAVAVPGLVKASESLKQNVQTTVASLQRTPQNPALIYLFMNQVKAYLAVSESIPRPEAFPQTAEQQYGELREDLGRMGQLFEASLQTVNQGAQAREADPSARKRYADDNTKLLPPGKLPRVVFLGDSITDFWHLNEYFTGRDFINRGISGQTTIQMLGRFLSDVVNLHPRAVLILAGTNDIGHGVELNAIEDDLTMMGDLAKGHGVKPLFASVLPASDYHKDVDPRYERVKSHPSATIQTLNKWLQDYCRKESFVYVDYYAALVDATGQMQTDLSDDGLHPNGKGYRLMSPIALEAIGRVVSGTDITPADEAQPKRRFRMLGK